MILFYYGVLIIRNKPPSHYVVFFVQNVTLCIFYLENRYTAVSNVFSSDICPSFPVLPKKV